MESVRTRYMGHGELHLIHGILGLYNLDWNVFFFFCDMTIASVGVYSTGHCSPYCGTPFQVQGVWKETKLTQGRHCEESWVVALVLTFVKHIRTNCFNICFCVKSNVIKLLRIMVLQTLCIVFEYG